MDSFDTAQKRKQLTWPVIALMDFVTVIGFDDIIYNFQNQGLAVVSDWILLLILFVIPYELIVGQLGSTFSNDGGGLSSWIRHTSGDKMGYITAWCYWVVSLPYLVDVANSTVVSFASKIGLTASGRVLKNRIWGRNGSTSVVFRPPLCFTTLCVG